MLTWRNAAIAILVLLCVGAWIYTAKYYNRHKADIILQVADAAEALALPYRIIQLSSQPPDAKLAIPVRGLVLSDIEDTFGAPRPDDREHEGLDVFAPTGTPVYALAPGYVIRKGVSGLGGNHLYIIGAGGRRYYYAHFDRFAPDIGVGTKVTVDTLIGYVGSTGNASTTPPHLHFGVYKGGAINPYELLVPREEL